MEQYLRHRKMVILSSCMNVERRLYALVGIALQFLMVSGSRIRIPIKHSPMQEINVLGRHFFIKRDDLLSLSPSLSTVTGNKCRKLWYLNSMDVFPKVVVSCGGSQSNAMRALALLCQQKQSKFIFFSRMLSKALKDNPSGNLKDAMNAGMQLEEVDSDDNFAAISAELMNDRPWQCDLVQRVCAQDSMLVPMGVSNDLVEAGVKALMSEVNEFIKSNSNGRPWKMVMASGTGATAYFAARFACEELQIVAVPCVGKSEYLEKLLLDLTIKFGSIDSKSLHVISTAAVPNRAFAQVTRVHWDLWKTITSCTNIDFDLLYAPRVFEILRSICPKREDGDRESLKSLFSGYNIIYYHCGGMEGNPSQIQRYKSRYPGIE